MPQGSQLISRLAPASFIFTKQCCTVTQISTLLEDPSHPKAGISRAFFKQTSDLQSNCLEDLGTDMWKFLAPKCKPRDNAIHSTAWGFCGFGFGFFYTNLFSWTGFGLVSNSYIKKQQFQENCPCVCTTDFHEEKKKLSSISEHLSSCLSAKSYWAIIQETILAAIVVAPDAVRSRVHFTVAGCLCEEDHEGSQAKQHCKDFYCSAWKIYE